jgi:hypothetical protein
MATAARCSIAMGGIMRVAANLEDNDVMIVLSR